MADRNRYKATEAAAVAGIDPHYVYRLVREGVFTGMHPFGKGPGKRMYLLTGEVDAYAGKWAKRPDGGPEAVKAYRKAHRIPEPKGK